MSKKDETESNSSDGKSANILSNWGLNLINKLVHPFTIIATPVFILILVILFIIRAFATDLFTGVRSFAGALLPVITMTFIFIFHRPLLSNLTKLGYWASYFISLVLAIGIMVVITFFGNYSQTSTIPVCELVLSGSFSLLVFSYVNRKENKILAYYYGVISGFLIYIILAGFPLNLR
jgi:magnesium-transporting ATPase (P-type)